MDFDWMDYQVPEAIVARNAESRVRQHRTEARLRAGLLRRLGRDQEFAVHRVLGNRDWACELLPLGTVTSSDDLRAAVAEAYTR